MENDGIKQFMAGYIQGVTDVNPENKVIISYVGDFQDTAKAKEISQRPEKYVRLSEFYQ